MDINWTTVISSGLVAIIISITQLVTSRYTSRMLDRIERVVGKLGKNNKEA